MKRQPVAAFRRSGSRGCTVAPADDDDDECQQEVALSAEQRFYYLRLMARPSDDRKEPIKTKFVRWTQPIEQHSLDADTDLENQAMRVVRTIGQAFEVCHKVAQEQMQEKHQEDIESTSNTKPKGSVTSIEAEHPEIEEKLSKVCEASVSPSPTDEPPPPAPGPAFLQSRHSIFMPRRPSEPSGLLSSEPFASTSAANKDLVQPGTSAESGRQQSVTASQPSQIPQPTIGIPPNSNQIPIVSGSATLPHSITWAPQMTAGQFQSMQSLDQRGFPTSIPVYPLPLTVGPSASMPYGLSSPLLLSPYATLQPQQQTPRRQSDLQIAASANNPNIPVSPSDGQDLTAIQLSISLDQYNQHLIRSQLDQAQQTAQVASCQVQLLRDQLTSETTARIEAQSRTHQLLTANRELLEQVQALVLRLQSLESRLANEIQEQITRPSTSKGTLPSTSSQLSKRSMAQAETQSFHEKMYEAKVPGPAPIDPSKPYQLQSLADVRAGSLPPQGNREEPMAESMTKSRRILDDSGVRTEPESGADDTTDYSSSDPYEKTTMPRNLPQRPQQAFVQPHLNILMSNPQALPNIPSFFSAQTPIPSPYIPDYLSYASVQEPNSEASYHGKEEFSDHQGGPSSSQRKGREWMSGVLSSDHFSRMSFNPKLRETKRKDNTDSVGSPIPEGNDDDHYEESIKRFQKRSMDDSIVRVRKSEKFSERGKIVEEEPSTSAAYQLKNPEIGQNLALLKLERQKSEPSEVVPLEVASTSVATAMYPPRRIVNPMRAEPAATPAYPSLPRRMLRTSSMDVRSNRAVLSNGPVLSKMQSTTANHVGGFTGLDSETSKLSSGGSIDHMLVLQEALKHGLANTRHQLNKTNETLDGITSPRRYADSQKQKLGDPTVLARLTRLPMYKGGGDDERGHTSVPSPTASKPTTAAATASPSSPAAATARAAMVSDDTKSLRHHLRRQSDLTK